MAETATPFDGNVFGQGFDHFDAVPVLLKIEVTPQQREVVAGQAVVIKIQVGEQTTSFGRTFLFNPGVIPSITIYVPNQNDQITVQPTTMIPLETGVYMFRHQTVSGAVKGVYSAVFNATNGSMSMLSPKHAVYTII